MARDAAFHAEFGVEGDERKSERKLSLGNLAVAPLAEDPSGHHVPAVGEAHVLAKLVHPLPGDRLSRSQHFHQLDLLAALPDRVFVAVQADLTCRDGGVLGLFRSGVALGARNFLLRYMDLVYESDGLLDIGRQRASESEGRNAGGG
jgi:hypothetical protein